MLCGIHTEYNNDFGDHPDNDIDTFKGDRERRDTT